MGYGALLALITTLIVSVFVVAYRWLNSYVNKMR